jgi:hypothetical protein
MISFMDEEQNALMKDYSYIIKLYLQLRTYLSAFALLVKRL